MTDNTDTPTLPVENHTTNIINKALQEAGAFPLEQAQKPANETKALKPTLPMETTPKTKNTQQAQKHQNSTGNNTQKHSKKAPKDAHIRNGRREEVFTLLTRMGAFSRPSRKLLREIAEKYTTSERVVYEDVNYWYAKIGNQAPEVAKLAKASIQGMTAALMRAMEIVNNPDPRIAAIGIRTMSTTIMDLVVLLEKYGYKEIMTPEIMMDNDTHIRPTQIIIFEQNTLNVTPPSKEQIDERTENKL